MEPGVRRPFRRGPPLREDRPGHRRRPALHGRLRHRPRARAPAARGGPLHQPRGPHPALRGGPQPPRQPHRAVVRLLRAPAVDRRAHARPKARARGVLRRGGEPHRLQGRPQDAAGGPGRALRHPRPRPRPRPPHADHAARRRPRGAGAAAAHPRRHRVRSPGRLGQRPHARQRPRHRRRHQDAALRRHHARAHFVLRRLPRRGRVARRHAPGVHRRQRHRVRRRRGADRRGRPRHPLLDRSSTRASTPGSRSTWPSRSPSCCGHGTRARHAVRRKSDVDLGNAAPDEVVSVEMLRLGLRGDTLLHFH